MRAKTVIIVGAGPGGLSAGMLLARNGYQVRIFEKKNQVGGRSFPLKLKQYTFDLGPTFFLMKDILEDIFSDAGRNLENYVQLMEIDPLYRLVFDENRVFYPTRNQDKMREQMEAWIPGSFQGYLKYIQKEKKKYNSIIPCLRVPYSSLGNYFSWRFIRSLPRLDAHISLFRQLGRYFEEPDMRVAFSFQAKYLGMSPWSCPGTFSILSFIEHSGGVFHVKGGLNRLSQAMAKVIEEEGGRIHLETPIREIIIKDRKAVGVKLCHGDEIKGDYVIINADFAYAMDKLVPEIHRRKWRSDTLKRKKYSCSTFMLYLGVDNIYDIPHHNIVFARDYKKNVDEISRERILSSDPSFYIQNASVTDDTLAPPGKSAIYVLVPAPNNKSRIDWQKEKEPFKNLILDLMEKRAGFSKLKDHIEIMKIITPADWEDEENIFLGATFNLAHSMDQMLYLRPHNRFEEFENCYLVGGGTHPGSGLPTIYESGNISAKLIMQQDGMKVVWK